MLVAITRQVSPALNDCELSFVERQPIDTELARKQHAQYEETLRDLGVQVHSLPAERDLPDSVFVEDVALVLDECAVTLNPGAPSRRPELASVEKAIEPYRDFYRIQPPDTLDGGDILRLGRTIFVGLSRRSTAGAAEQLQALLKPHQYQVRTMTVAGCLHLKSAVTRVSRNTLLLNPIWVSKEQFVGMDCIEIHPSEPHAANALMVGDTVIYPTAFPKTAEKLQAAGIRMVFVDVGELAKAEGAVTCCSLIFTV